MHGKSMNSPQFFLFLTPRAKHTPPADFSRSTPAGALSADILQIRERTLDAAIDPHQPAV